MTELLEGLNPGDIFTEKGFLSTSSNKDIALRNFGPGLGSSEGEIIKASQDRMRSSSFWAIKLPAGSKALGIPKTAFGYASGEDEVILPRDSRLKIIGLRKVPQVDDDGDVSDRFNYFVEAEFQPKSETPSETETTKEDGASGIGESDLLDALIDGTKINRDVIYETKGIPSNFEVKDISDSQYLSLKSYRSLYYEQINNALRSKSKMKFSVRDIQEDIENIDALIEEHGTVTEDGYVYRGAFDRTRLDENTATMFEILDSAKPGDIISEPGYTSTSNDGLMALDNFGPGKLISGLPEASQGHAKSTAFWSIKVPKGSKALAFPEDAYLSGEDEVLLPRDSQFKIIGIRKVPQVSSESGTQNGNFNYFVDAELQPKTSTPTPKPTVDMSGTRLTDEAKEELADLVTRSAAVDNQASIRAYKKVASDLGREVSVPWDRETPETPEGAKTYKYIRSAEKFEKDVPENDEEKELLRIKNLLQETLDNDEELQKMKAELSSNQLYKDMVDALNSQTNNFEERDINYTLADIKRNLSGGSRPKLSEAETEEFSISTPDYADDAINELVYDVTVTPDESVEITNKDLKEFSDSAAVSVVLPISALKEVLNDGRMKTVHETKYSVAGNSSEDYRGLRVGYESLAFGYTGDSPMEERPVYGLLRSAEHPMPKDALLIYGGYTPAQIILKPEVKNRTTISDRDSLNNFEATTPLTDPKFEASYLTQMIAIYKKATGKSFLDTENFAKYGSIEAQVHGGVRLEDIGKVLFYETPSEEIRELLTSKGIIWEVSKKEPYTKPSPPFGGMF
jgi:CRP-like cAMP-binding protein